MANRSLLNKLGSFPSQAEEIFLLFRRAGEVSADDEFEMDYLVDAVERNLKKLHTIVKRYEKSSTEIEPSLTAEEQQSRNAQQVESRITNDYNKNAKTSRDFENEECDDCPAVEPVVQKAGRGNALLGPSDERAVMQIGEIAADTDSDGTVENDSEEYQDELKPVSLNVLLLTELYKILSKSISITN